MHVSPPEPRPLGVSMAARRRGLLGRAFTAAAAFCRGSQAVSDNWKARPVPSSVPSDASFADRLWSMCDLSRARWSGPDQAIALRCTVASAVPDTHALALLQAADALVAHAIRCGMSMQLIGRIDVRVVGIGSISVLEVEDDGWGHFSRSADASLSAARRVAEARGGGLQQEQSWAFNVARIWLPR